MASIVTYLTPQSYKPFLPFPHSKKTAFSPSYNLSASSDTASVVVSLPKHTKEAGPEKSLNTRTVIRRSDRPKSVPLPPMAKEFSIDPLGNFVPSSCFETAASISILDRPGKAGETLDLFARQFARTLELVYSPDGIGDTIVQYQGKGITLRERYNIKILAELRPKCDQIGRCPDISLEEEWFKGAGVKWLKAQLEISSRSPHYTYANTLTKVRVLHPFGLYIVIELLADSKNAPVIAKLLGKEEAVVLERYNSARKLVWDPEFNAVDKRARMERAPLVGAEYGLGTSLEGTPLRDGNTCDFGYGYAFGLVFHPDDVKPLALQEQYRKDLQKFGQQGIKRVNQPIQDYERPGILSEHAVHHMPISFRSTGLESQLGSHRFIHGTGLNRWHSLGSYAKESRAHSLPAAGSHSGGASNFFVGLNCLSEEPILGRKDIAEQCGLLFSAFANFGGYHTIVETFPIAQAVAANAKFRIVVNERQGTHGKHLYADFVLAARAHTKAGRRVSNLRSAYQECLTPEEQARNRRRLPFAVTPLPLDEEETKPLLMTC
ncbi:MAG TPA: hypothetical protein VLG44_04420 [Chlamydiales bacterium]|nr:hypothetical protein [Chlamydiales bacterium]